MARRPDQISKPVRPPRPHHRIGTPVLESPIARGPVILTFPHQSVGGRPLDAIELTIRHTLGVTRRVLAAATLGVRGAHGIGRVTIDLSRLPAGPLEIALVPWEKGRAVGDPARVSFEIPCCGPTAPAAIHLTPIARRVARPTRADSVNARFLVATKERNTGSIFVTVEAPDGTADTLDLATPSDGTELELFAFGATHGLGRYRLAVVPVSAEGAIGATTETAIELVGSKGEGGPWIDAVTTTKDGAGISIRGGGFTDPRLTVSIGGIPVAIRALRPGQLLVAEPDGLDQPGGVVITAREGVARSRAPWAPPVRVTIVPGQFTLAEGESLQLTAVVRGTSEGKVAWSLKGGAGVRVDRTGKVTAGFVDRPVRFQVIARAGGARGPTAFATGAVTARTGRVATRVTLGRLGGVVRSADGGSRLVVPERALKSPSRVAVHPVAPRRRAGRGTEPFIAAEARLEPAGQRLARPAHLELALAVPLEPGATVPVQVQRGRGRRWDPLDQPGVVGFGGKTVAVVLDVIPVRIRVAVDIRWDHATPRNLTVVAPLIFSVGPAILDEGVTAAVLVTGVNFVPGLTTIEFIRQNGAMETRIAVRSVAVTADGTRLGFGLKVGVMEDLGEGQVSYLELRVRSPAGFATASFSIRGHDELDVLTGVRTVSQSAVFSRVDVEPGARLNVANAFPPITIECFERAYLRSTFDEGGGVIVAAGHGAGGAAGDGGGMGGLAGPGAGTAGLGAGGSGGAGATGSGGVGATGIAGRPSVSLTRAGAGGIGGGAGGGGPFPHAGGDGASGSPGIRSSFIGVDLAVEPSPGGGGGGGGGGEGWIFQATGGGGGGGGAGGGALTIAAGEEITLQGDVVAAGGNGAFGSYPYTVAFRPMAASLIQAGGGGGGGGGAGGSLVLQGVNWWTGAVLAVGGNSGRAPGYGQAPVDARTNWQRLLQQPPTGAIRIDGEMPVTVGGAFLGPDLDYVYDLLATTADVEVRAPGGDVVRVAGSAMQTALFDTEIDPMLGGRTRVTLFDGFNEVRSDWTAAGQSSPPQMTCAAIRRRVFLYLPDTIPFYEFACTVAPSAPTVPTERTAQLTATVTARPTTRLAWDVWGGTATEVGTIQPDSSGTGARYTAPTLVPRSAVLARAISTLDPARYAAATITIVPGIELASTAQSGTPATPGVPSINVGQDLAIAIPATVLAQTSETFAGNQAVEFDLIERQPNGTCATRRVPYQATLDAGLAGLTIAVPACAAPTQTIRVPGHGSLPIQVVPVITAIVPDPSNFPNLAISGSGFACGGTTVVFITGPVLASDIVSVSCDRIELRVRPSPGSEVRVRTAGGTSAGFLAP